MAYVNNPASAFLPSTVATPQPQQQQQQPQQQQPPGQLQGQAGGSSLALLNMSNLINQKDSRWLQLEVCREFQRNKCSRSDTECKFAHPTSNVEVQNGRVTACYDSIKGRCNREKPPCKYFHPPQHLKDQLLINGRNHLALKNALMQQMGYMSQPFLAGQFPSMNSGYVAFPHATPAGYIPSPLQSPFLTSPLAHINPMMSLFPSVTSASDSMSMVSSNSVAAADTNALRNVQMQAALLPMCPSQFQQQQQQQQQQLQQQLAQHAQHGGKVKGHQGDRVEGVVPGAVERNL